MSGLRPVLGLVVAASLALMSAPTEAQGNCRNQPSRDQFDFWIGEWNLYNEFGTFLGRQTVVESQSGCLIESSWVSTNGSTHSAMNVYDPLLNGWRQIQVGADSTADLRGAFSGTTMTLEGNAFVNDTQTSILRRRFWTSNADGTITQTVQERPDTNTLWTTVFSATARSVANDPDTQAAPGPASPMPGQPDCWALANRRDFDFWAGDWNVGSSHNRISKIQGGCLLREQWNGGGNDTGVSYNFYDPFVNQWRQVWMSPGVFIDTVGGLIQPSGAMQLEGTISYHASRQAPFRGTWTLGSFGNVTQFLEEQNNGIWGQWFNGNYVRSNVQSTLTVATAGLGSGTVTSAPSGINCGVGTSNTCSNSYAIDSRVQLAGAASTDSTFAGWGSGPCQGTPGNCAWNIGSNTSAEARFTLNTVPEGRVVAAMLPGARSGFVGGTPITIFASVVSRQSTPAQSCAITAPNGAPTNFSYRRVDATNTAIGTTNPVFDLASGGSASFILVMSPQSATPAQGYTFFPVVTCENAALTAVEGVNSFTLSIGTAPVPDILSIAATPSADGVIRIANSGAVNFMTAAAVNIGAGDGSAGANEATITVTADTGSADLPLTLQVCETASTGGCLAPRSSEVTSVFGSEAKFFAVFARAQSGSAIPFNPAGARVYLRFRDANGTIRSVTSAAVTAPE